MNIQKSMLVCGVQCVCEYVCALTVALHFNLQKAVVTSSRRHKGIPFYLKWHLCAVRIEINLCLRCRENIQMLKIDAQVGVKRRCEAKVPKQHTATATAPAKERK